MNTRVIVTLEDGTEVFNHVYRNEVNAASALADVMVRHERCKATVEKTADPVTPQSMREWEARGFTLD